MIAKHLIDKLKNTENGGVFITDSEGNWSMIDSINIDNGGNVNLKLWNEDLIYSPQKERKEIGKIVCTSCQKENKIYEEELRYDSMGLRKE